MRDNVALLAILFTLDGSLVVWGIFTHHWYFPPQHPFWPTHFWGRILSARQRKMQEKDPTFEAICKMARKRNWDYEYMVMRCRKIRHAR